MISMRLRRLYRRLSYLSGSIREFRPAMQGNRGGDHGVLALGHIGQGIAHEVDAAAQPGGAHDVSDRALEAFVDIGDDQLYAGQAAPAEVFEEVRPEDLDFGRPMCSDAPPPAPLGFDGHGDYRRNADDPAAVTHLEVGGVKPEIGPLPISGRLRKARTRSSMSLHSLETENLVTCPRSSGTPLRHG